MEEKAYIDFQNHSEKLNRRWYDQDPVLSKAMKTLQSSSDEIQIKIALNLIKIVIEHQIEQQENDSIEDIISSVNGQNERKERWYDLNETVRAAIIMLEQCPNDLQKKIAVDMAELITRVITED